MIKPCQGRECNLFILRAILLLLVGIILYIGYLLFHPVNVYTFEAPYKPVQDVYHPGDIIDVRQVYCKEEPLPAVVDISLVDGYVEALRTINVNTPVGCYDRVSTSASVPPYLSEGFYRLRYVFTVRVNPLRTEIYTVETELFKVEAE